MLSLCFSEYRSFSVVAVCLFVLYVEISGVSTEVYNKLKHNKLKFRLWDSHFLCLLLEKAIQGEPELLNSLINVG